MKLHRAVNDLHQIRPVVLIDEVPWSEMDLNNELTLQCENLYLKEIEWYMKSKIYMNKYMPADMIIPPYIPIMKVISSTGIGISVDEEVIATDVNNKIISHRYNDLLKTDDDLLKLHNPVITYNLKQTIGNYNLVGEILGDIIPVKISGIPYYSVTTWDEIAIYRGVTNLLVDLADRPDFMHKLVRRLTDISLHYVEQVERLGLFDNDPYILHCTPILTNDLPGRDTDGTVLKRKNVWGRGVAQIFASVSKKMHEEFDIEYMKETIGKCGLAYYGCCEPLDKKIDIVEKIPNLRKISITPWADVNIAAEAINTKYVLSSKPNPAAVAEAVLDKENLKKEINEILDACRRNRCNCDIVLKDISTCSKNPNNIFEWEKIVMDMVKNY